jgi:hypothetical protein
MRFYLSLLFILVAVCLPISTIVAQEASVSPNGTVDDRLSRAVSDQKVVLDDIASNNIKAKCQAAQTVLTNMQLNTDSMIRKRIETYSALQKELIAIQLRMVRQGSDASEIDLLVGKIQQALDKFTLAGDQYGTTLQDVSIVNCVQKPEQFQAGLLLLRLQRLQLLRSATDLKNIVLSAPLYTYEPLKKRLTF